MDLALCFHIQGPPLNAPVNKVGRLLFTLGLVLFSIQTKIMKIIVSILFCIATLYTIQAQADMLETKEGTVLLTPIYHGTLVMEWNETTVFIDPYGGAERFYKFNYPDIVCITHAHGDHLNKETLEGLDLSETALIAPQSVIDELGDIEFAGVKALANGESIEVLGLHIEAVPMYNLPNDESARHAKGWGNGYVFTIGGTRFYFSGDTEDIPEMRSLEKIDYAFVCMNLPYTMTVENAADAVLDFKPIVVYPYHYRGKDGFSDIEKFKSIVNEGDENIEVRLRDWYPE